ncbi:RPM1-interacting protein 4-like isoform X2 [Malania oleifera]|uniref:RPM1-interacting protein 4-like isoform X2 n=1 Tax=Malania oleifera TaxID=397392 RepID=UPI0025AE41A4|nr:RPM1-interacting protein 4-like isoform X2 [Malania oleifera]XP_057957635.1 RPM1-interacting protein 4-like isoform X2 [Malania oleifera]XP_057957636.1 RPM1-interacting protein 4-like isoform X2 [Malania oleifera]XP_057957637.1 RPM1-interacting protein 4-like isoform X2 [Malania oleifera]
MAQRSSVPKFGNWESEENVPYTAYFEKARKDKGGRKMDPNDSQSDSDMLSKSTHPVQAPPFQTEVKPEAPKGSEAVRSRHERRISREDVELRRLTESPLHHDHMGRRPVNDLSHQSQGGVRYGSSKTETEGPKVSEALRPNHERRSSKEDGDVRIPIDPVLHHDAAGRGASADWPHQRHGRVGSGDNPKKVVRQGAGSDRSVEHSPLHPHHQARVGGKGSGVSSPSWERKGSSEGSSHGLGSSTPGRSRLRSGARGDETPDHNAAVPKFGDWDETNPASADGYTHIFNKVREERQSGTGKVPIMSTDTYYPNGQKHGPNRGSKKSCCFPWGRK